MLLALKLELPAVSWFAETSYGISPFSLSVRFTVSSKGMQIITLENKIIVISFMENISFRTHIYFRVCLGGGGLSLLHIAYKCICIVSKVVLITYFF